MSVMVGPEPAGAGQLQPAVTDRIRALNDAFRTSLQGGRIMLTAGFSNLPPTVQNEAITALRFRAEFDPGNDPYQEHDFGSIICGGETLFWKIDCYDLDLRFASPDPGDPKVTIRVLTVMLADEY